MQFARMLDQGSIDVRRGHSETDAFRAPRQCLINISCADESNKHNTILQQSCIMNII